VVTSLSIWGKESVAGTKSRISQEVFPLWDFQAMVKAPVVERAICSTPFPSNKHEGKKHVKVANSHHILGEVAIPISPTCSSVRGRANKQMATINSPDGIFEKWVESWVSSNAGRQFISTRLAHVN
jgi:hypothetical protein